MGNWIDKYIPDCCLLSDSSIYKRAMSYVNQTTLPVDIINDTNRQYNEYYSVLIKALPLLRRCAKLHPDALYYIGVIYAYNITDSIARDIANKNKKQIEDMLKKYPSKSDYIGNQITMLAISNLRQAVARGYKKAAPLLKYMEEHAAQAADGYDKYRQQQIDQWAQASAKSFEERYKQREAEAEYHRQHPEVRLLENILQEQKNIGVEISRLPRYY
jgi:hypothetical protein